MKIDLLTTSTKKSDITISETTFGKDFNESLVHQAVVSYMAGSRQGSSKQKTRSEVRGGGVTFASTPRDYSKKINKKMYRAALRSIFSELLRQGKLVAIETPVLEKPKTKEIAKFLSDFSLSKVLFITDTFDSNFYLSARNIPNVDVITVKEINPVILLRADKVAVTAEAFKLIEEWI